MITADNICHSLTNLHLPITTAQVLIVKSAAEVKAQVILCEKTNEWHTISTAIPAVIGMGGVASIGTKQEGDLKTPAGLYPINWTFGTQALALQMDYRFITDDDKFIDDPQHPDYNTWIQGPTTANSYEPMLVPSYKMGAVIDYNMNPVNPGHGSAIFLHIWQSAELGTAGCVAMSEQNLLKVLQWFNKTQHPYIYIL